MDGKKYTLKWGPHDGAKVVVFGNAPPTIFAPCRCGFEFVPYTNQPEAQYPFQYVQDQNDPERYVFHSFQYQLQG